MIDQPLISVIVPCYNQGVFLSDSLQSIYEQTYLNWECYIVNDGSTDDTERIALQWNKKDERFKYIYKENGGLSSARNKGLDEASGAFIQFLDADDLIDHEKFAVSLKSAGFADVIMSNFIMFTNKYESYTSPPFTLNKNNFSFESILSGWDEAFVFPPHCGLFKSFLFDKLRFNETLKAREDWVMWLQIYQLEIETVFIDRPYALYRVSPNSMSKNKPLMDRNLVIAYEVIYEFLPGKYRDVFFKKVIHSLGGLLADANMLLAKTRLSKSYRFGNYFVRKFNRIKQFFN